MVFEIWCEVKISSPYYLYSLWTLARGQIMTSKRLKWKNNIKICWPQNKNRYIHTIISEAKNPPPGLYFFREFNHYYTVTNMLPPRHDILIIFLSWLFFQIGYVRSAFGRPNITIFEKKVNLKKLSKHHAEVATY